MRFLLSVVLGVVLFACQQNGHDNSVRIAQTVMSPDQVQIHYEVHGEGAPCLVFVHGWGCKRTYWEEQVRHLSPRYRVVTIDLAGHGESGADRREWSIESFAGDVASVADDLNLQEMILIGHSMGGPVVAAAAGQMKGRVKGIIGVDTFQDVAEKPTVAQVDSFLAPLIADYPTQTEAFVRGFLFNPDSDSALVERVLADALSMPYSIGIPMLRSLFLFDEAAALRDAEAPLVCINSDKYPIKKEALEEVTPFFELKTMTGVAHYPMLEKPEVFNQLLSEAVGSLLQE